MSSLITGIILVKNEEKHIFNCVKSLNFCDEILIINDNSTDKTVELITKLNNKKVKIVPFVLEGDFSKARNFGLSKARGDWIFFIDADEQVPPSLAFEISNVISNWANKMGNEYSGFYIRRFDSMWGRKLRYGESGIKLLRLAKKNAGEWVGKVHEEWKIDGRIGVLKNSIDHYPHQSIGEFLREINFYTDIRSIELKSKKTKIYFWSILAYPLGKFIVNFIFKRGFLDGIHGLIFAINMSFHSFLVRGKLWLVWNKK